MSIKAVIDAVEYNGVDEISVGGKDVNLEEVFEGDANINANGTYDVSGKKRAIVNVSGESARLITKRVTANGIFSASADGADGYSEIEVEVEAEPISLQQKTATSNGEFTPDAGYVGFSKFTVNVATSGLSFDDVVRSSRVGSGWNEHNAYDGAEITLTNGSRIRSYAFAGTSVKSVSAVAEGVATGIGAGAFYKCTSLESVDFPNMVGTWTSDGNGLFYGCTKLRSVNMPVFAETAQSINSMFHTCTALQSISMPACKGVGNSMFYGCSALSSVSMPEVIAINASAFRGCKLITSLDFPKAKVSGADVFNGCTNLNTIVLGSTEASNFSTTCFSGCTALEKLVIRSETMSTILSGGVFANATQPKTVYVPSALISTYEANSMWAQAMASYGVTFAAIEGSEYDV